MTLLLMIIVWQFKDPRCGGFVNPNDRYCQKGKLINAPIPNSCDPISNTIFTQNLLRFLEYMTNTIHRARPSPLKKILSDLTPNGNVYSGVLVFAIPELLKILPSDFGQNYTTPYGVISFYETMIPCIQETDSLCRYLVGKDDLVQNNLCLEYFRFQKHKLIIQQNQKCPFVITDHNPNLWIEDIPFFNSLGLLGTFSLTSSQAVVVFNDLPVQDFRLNYWSYNVYIADDLNPDLTCSPYLQTHVASVTTPFNMFHCVAESGNKFNPLTGQGTLQSGHVRFYLVITFNKLLGEEIVQELKTRGAPVDCIHVCEIPTGAGTMPIDPSLPNPNRFTTNDALYQPQYQRLCSFLRLSLQPDATEEEKSRLRDFIYHKDNYLDSFDVVLVEKGNLSSQNIQLFSTVSIPRFISPRVDEIFLYKNEFQHIQKKVNSLLWRGYHLKRLPTRPTTLNIFAPEFRKVRNTKKPYQGGWQAIQLAGNAQGDNSDTQYRTSKADCLADGDVMIALCMNHASLKNCIYNSINLVDVNKAYGYDGFVMDASQRYYIILIGRNVELVNRTESILQSALNDIDILFHKILIRTGSSVDGNIPMCHQVLMVERIYMNTIFSCINDPTKVYALEDLFGDRLQDLHVDTEDDAWNSLITTTAPDASTLIQPVFIKASFSKQVITKILGAILVFVLILLMITIWLFENQKAKK